MKCTTCDQQIPAGASWIAVRIDGEGFQFAWACEHHPQPGEIILGSAKCAVTWAAEHPAYEAVIWRMLTADKKDC